MLSKCNGNKTRRVSFKEGGSNLSILIYAIIPIVIGLGVSGIFLFYNRKKDKVDQGFVFAYHKLSYRRKMMRTLWSLPLILLVHIQINLFVNLQNYENLIIFILFLSVFLLQLSYNFYRWRKDES